jgi:hypothetical protein
MSIRNCSFVSTQIIENGQLALKYLMNSSHLSAGTILHALTTTETDKCPEVGSNGSLESPVHSEKQYPHGIETDVVIRIVQSNEQHRDAEDSIRKR